MYMQYKDCSYYFFKVLIIVTQYVVVSEMTYTVSSGTLNHTTPQCIPYHSMLQTGRLNYHRDGWVWHCRSPYGGSPPPSAVDQVRRRRRHGCRQNSSDLCPGLPAEILLDGADADARADGVGDRPVPKELRGAVAVCELSAPCACEFRLLSVQLQHPRISISVVMTFGFYLTGLFFLSLFQVRPCPPKENLWLYFSFTDRV